MTSPSERYRAIFDALTTARESLGEPTEIILIGPGVTLHNSWSKSAINNNTQVVFLIAGHAIDANAAAVITAIRCGDETFPVSQAGKRAPTEDKPYWFFPVE